MLQSQSNTKKLDNTASELCHKYVYISHVYKKTHTQNRRWKKLNGTISFNCFETYTNMCNLSRSITSFYWVVFAAAWLLSSVLMALH